MIKIVKIPLTSVVELQLQEPFGALRNERYRSMQDVLEGLDGVEEVTVRRYTVTLFVAPHLEEHNIDTVSREVRDLLEAWGEQVTINEINPAWIQ